MLCWKIRYRLNPLNWYFFSWMLGPQFFTTSQPYPPPKEISHDKLPPGSSNWPFHHPKWEVTFNTSKRSLFVTHPWPGYNRKNLAVGSIPATSTHPRLLGLQVFNLFDEDGSGSLDAEVDRVARMVLDVWGGPKWDDMYTLQGMVFI